jgi:hypothetical protein
VTTDTYKYKDFETGQQRWTRAPFGGWTLPTGLLNVRYAIFRRKSEALLVPEYLLTAETRNRLPAPSSLAGDTDSAPAPEKWDKETRDLARFEHWLVSKDPELARVEDDQ